MPLRWPIAVAVAVVVATLTRSAAAQTSPTPERDAPQNPASPAGGGERDAEPRSLALFKEARAAFEAGDCSTAIPKLHESVRLYPSVGAHLTLAECAASDPLGAFRELKEAEREALARGDDRAAYAREKAAALAPRLAWVRIAMWNDRAVAVQVRLDASPVDDRLWQAPFPVSPGLHTVEVSAPGRKTWTGPVTASVGTTVTADVVMPADSVASSPAVTEQAASAGANGRRTAGYVVAGVGVAGVVAGTVLGAMALHDKGDVRSKCGAGYPPSCNAAPDAQAGLRSEASGMATKASASTVAFVVGGAAVATGVVLYFTARGARVGVQVTPVSASVAAAW